MSLRRLIFDLPLRRSGQGAVNTVAPVISINDGVVTYVSAGTWTGNPTITAALVDETDAVRVLNMIVNGTYQVQGTDAGHTLRLVETADLGGVTADSNTIALTAPIFTTLFLPDPIVGVAYSATIVAVGTDPITYSVIEALPDGLSLNASTGEITGTPTTEGADTFRFTATDDNTLSTNQEYDVYTWTAPAITNTTLAPLTQSTAFSDTVDVTGTAPITFAVQAGTLPTGLSLSATTGAITGTPTGTGAYDFTIRASSYAGYDDQQYTGTIAAYAGDFGTQIAALPGAFLIYPMTETSGTVVDNSLGDATLDGTYKNGVSLAATAFPVGSNVVHFDGANDAIELVNAAFNAAFNGAVGWALACFKGDDFADFGTYLLNLNVDANNRIYFGQNPTTGDQYLYRTYYRAGAVTKYAQMSGSEGWHIIAMCWDKTTTNDMYYWFDGIPIAETSGSGGLGTWAGTLSATQSALFALRSDTGISSFLGSGGWAAFGAGQVLTDTLMANLYAALFPTINYLLATGDSKTTSNDYWINKVLDWLGTTYAGTWREYPRLGYSGQRVDYWYTHLQTDFTEVRDDIQHVLINICANDISNGTAEATVKTNLAGGIDYLISKCPNAKIWLTQPYRADADYEAYILSLSGWIKDVEDSYGQNVRIANNETEWFKDDIATLSPDNIHPNTEAGYTAATAIWSAAINNLYIKALFASDQAAGFTSPLALTLGRLVRSADTGTLGSIADGDLIINGAATTGYADPAYYLDDGYAPRGIVNGFSYLFTITLSADDEIAQVAMSDNTTVADGTQYGLRFYSDGKLYWTRAGTTWEIGTYTAAATYLVNLRQRDEAGMEVWIKGGDYVAWTLIFVDTLNPASGRFVPCVSTSGTTLVAVGSVLAGRIYRGTSDDSEYLIDTNPTNDSSVAVNTVNEGVFQIAFTPPASPAAGNYIELDYNRHYSSMKRLVRMQWNTGTSQWDFVSGHVISSVETLQGSPVANVGALTRIIVRSIADNNDFWGAVGDDFTKFYGTIVDAIGGSDFRTSVHWSGSFTGVSLRVWDSFDNDISDEIDTLAQR